MKTWTWLVAVALGLMSAHMVGCGGGDDSSSDAASTNATSSGSSSSGSTTNASSSGSSTPAADPGPRVLLDDSFGLDGGTGTGMNAAAAPAAGFVTWTVTWVTSDLLAGGAPIDIPLEFNINSGQAHNAAATSPFTGGTSAAAGQQCMIQIYNHTVSSVATVHVRAVWTRD